MSTTQTIAKALDDLKELLRERVITLQEWRAEVAAIIRLEQQRQPPPPPPSRPSRAAVAEAAAAVAAAARPKPPPIPPKPARAVATEAALATPAALAAPDRAQRRRSKKARQRARRQAA